MPLGKSSAKQPSAMRRNRSQSHHVPESTSSGTATAPWRMQLRLQRGSPPPSRTGRVSTTSAAYSFRSRSSNSNDRSVTSPAAAPNQMRNTLGSNQPLLGSPSTWDTSQMRPSPADETLVSWQNGSDTSLTGGHYSTWRTTGPGISPMPSSYSPPSTFPMTLWPRASRDGSSTPSPDHRPPSTPSTRPPTPPLTGDSTQTS